MGCNSGSEPETLSADRVLRYSGSAPTVFGCRQRSSPQERRSHRHSRILRLDSCQGDQARRPPRSFRDYDSPAPEFEEFLRERSVPWLQEIHANFGYRSSMKCSLCSSFHYHTSPDRHTANPVSNDGQARAPRSINLYNFPPCLNGLIYVLRQGCSDRFPLSEALGEQMGRALSRRPNEPSSIGGCELMRASFASVTKASPKLPALAGMVSQTRAVALGRHFTPFVREETVTALPLVMIARIITKKPRLGATND